MVETTDAVSGNRWWRHPTRTGLWVQAEPGVCAWVHLPRASDRKMDENGEPEEGEDNDALRLFCLASARLSGDSYDPGEDG